MVVNGVHDNQSLKELFYTGITRARDILVIVSERSYLEQVFDAEAIESLNRIEVNID